MSQARVARRIAAAAAYGGGGLGLLGVGLAGLLLTEAKLAEHQLNTLQGEPPRADGLYGAEFAGSAGDPPLLFSVLGDSTAAGFGVNRGRETPGALLAGGISSIAERPVRLEVAAANGATSADLDDQVTRVLGGEHVPDLALVMIGANDVTQRLKPAESVRLLGDALRRLRAAGAEVVVGTCPDLGTIEPVRPPLRWLARRASRQLAAAQTIAVVEAGARSVSLGDLLGPEFRGRPEMFASDRYHPSVQGYATASMALLPTLCAALDLWPLPTESVVEQPEVLPVAQAAAEAVCQAGTEVSGAEVQGAGSGPRGRWASLLQRRGRNLAERQLSTSDNSHGIGADLGAT